MNWVQFYTLASLIVITPRLPIEGAIILSVISLALAFVAYVQEVKRN